MASARPWWSLVLGAYGRIPCKGPRTQDVAVRRSSIQAKPEGRVPGPAQARRCKKGRGNRPKEGHRAIVQSLSWNMGRNQGQVGRGSSTFSGSRREQKAR